MYCNDIVMALELRVEKDFTVLFYDSVVGDLTPEKHTWKSNFKFPRIENISCRNDAKWGVHVRVWLLFIFNEQKVKNASFRVKIK